MPTTSRVPFGGFAVGDRARQVAARVRQVHRAQDHLDRPHGMTGYSNVTFKEIDVGATVSVERALSQTEVEALLLVSATWCPSTPKGQEFDLTTNVMASRRAPSSRDCWNVACRGRARGSSPRTSRLPAASAWAIASSRPNAVEKHQDRGQVVFDCVVEAEGKRVLTGGSWSRRPRARPTTPTSSARSSSCAATTCSHGC